MFEMLLYKLGYLDITDYNFSYLIVSLKGTNKAVNVFKNVMQKVVKRKNVERYVT